MDESKWRINLRHQGKPTQGTAWGRCTMKEQNGNTILYLSVFDWPKDGQLLVPGNNDVVSAKLLATGKSLSTQKVSDGIQIKLPADAPNPIASVIKLEVKGKIGSTPTAVADPVGGRASVN
jgi:alpha-L-fucosidase